MTDQPIGALPRPRWCGAICGFGQNASTVGVWLWSVWWVRQSLRRRSRLHYWDVAEFRFHHDRHLLLVTPGMSPALLARELDAQHVMFSVTLHGQPYCDRSLTHQFRPIWIEDVGYDARRYFDLIKAVLRKYGVPLLKTPGSFIHVRKRIIQRLG